MDYAFALSIALHTVAALVWVGGMFFAHMVLRPAASHLEPLERLHLWSRVLPRFFAWVWAAVLVLLTTGYGVLLTGYRGGITGGNLHIDIMQVTGLIMAALFVFLYFVPFARFKQAVARNDMAQAALAQATVRKVVGINLILGLFTVFIGAAGTFVGY